MYCKNCGKQIDDKAVICVYCGTFTDNYHPQNVYTAQTRTLVRDESYTPFLGLIFSVLGLFLSFFASIAGLVLSIIQFKRAKAVFGETKYACTGIVVASIIIGLNVLAFFVATYEGSILALAKLIF